MANPQAEIQQAMTLHRAGQLAQAEPLYRRALKRQPKNGDLLSMLGLVVAGQGRMSEGLELLRRAARAKVGDPAIHYNLANLARSMGQTEEAVEHYRASLAKRPAYAEAWYGLGCVLEQMRDREGAAEAAGRALELAPAHGMAAITLARIERASGDPGAARDRLTTMLGAGPRAAVERAHAYAELGKCHDALGDSNDAFAAFEQSQQALMEMPEYHRSNPAGFFGMVEASRALVDAAHLERWGGEPCDDGLPDPVFLVGFPRSGTTMAEQMLAAHSACVTTDERPFVQNIVRALPQHVPTLPYPACLDRLTPAQITALRRQYWDDVAAFTGRKTGSYTLIDKQPMNLAYVGLLSRLFPRGRMIVMLRDPRDTCLSCFMQAFTPNQAMSNFCTLEGTVRLYEAVMSHWLAIRASVPLQVLEVRYEDVVSETEAQARRLIDLTGLAWEDGVLDFHRRVGERFIRTPSYEAVARPVNAGAIGRWRRYAGRFEPYQSVLDPFVEAFGYTADQPSVEREDV